MTDESQQGFIEPKTLEEAESRRAQLATDIAAIQNQLGTLNKTTPEGRRLTVQEWEQWRKKAKAAHTHKCAELRAVKEWMQAYHRNYRLTAPGLGAGLSRNALATEAKRAMERFADFAAAMEDEIKHLQSENAALRERLAQYETAPVVAPGSDRDMWRDGYAKQDVA